MTNLVFVEKINAQPPLCGAPTNICSTSCYVCDLDGFSGTNDPGQLPPGFCTNILHHAEWVGFVACSANLTVEISMQGTPSGNGATITVTDDVGCTTVYNSIPQNCNCPTISSPTNPQDNLFCFGGTPTPISVDDHGAGFQVNYTTARAHFYRTTTRTRQHWQAPTRRQG